MTWIREIAFSSQKKRKKTCCAPISGPAGYQPQQAISPTRHWDTWITQLFPTKGQISVKIAFAHRSHSSDPDLENQTVIANDRFKRVVSWTSYIPVQALFRLRVYLVL